MSNDTSWSQASHTLILIGQQNPTTAHIKALHDGPITDLVQAIINGSLPPREKVREFYGLSASRPETTKAQFVPAVSEEQVSVMDSSGTLTVDYNLSLNQMIAAGHFGDDGDNWNKDITAERFPIVGVGIVEYEFKVFYLGCVTSVNIILTIRNDDKVNPWEPAKIEHILAYRSKRLKVQSSNGRMIGLGSVVMLGCDRRMPEISSDGVRWYLGLNWFDGFRPGRCYFLAVRKKVSGS